MRTHLTKPADALAARKWWVVDAKGQPLGRLASRVAHLLRGKHKPTYQPDVDAGDFVIVINAAQVKVSGTKQTDKMYYRHSGYPGAIKGESFRHLVGRRAEMPVHIAVKGMLPKNVLGREMLTKLKVYGQSDHPHQAQQPEKLSL